MALDGTYTCDPRWLCRQDSRNESSWDKLKAKKSLARMSDRRRHTHTLFFDCRTVQLIARTTHWHLRNGRIRWRLAATAKVRARGRSGRCGSGATRRSGIARDRHKCGVDQCGLFAGPGSTCMQTWTRMPKKANLFSNLRQNASSPVKPDRRSDVQNTSAPVFALLPSLSAILYQIAIARSEKAASAISCLIMGRSRVFYNAAHAMASHDSWPQVTDMAQDRLFIPQTHAYSQAII
ncbi:hypothetical protein B0T25DRAFT_313244 [Lasiosphaeria hispida]|uniref:Uncharacterized protein n=1 Tax=Lasiosphaeria hispida TaxID=260671 RepID=A0AAJ0M9F6_9PEZI|nr:hypothetical protein B0T25DRAFT_313244 [Lasiosphaeria hispida]